MDRGGQLRRNILFTLFVVIFAAGLLAIINNYANGAAVWEDYFAKEVAKAVDYSKAGDEINVDVSKAVKIAAKNDVALSEAFVFDNAQGEICVKLNKGRKGCFSYFNDLDVVNVDLKLGILSFDLVERRRGDE